ncbi:MAG: CDP-diacylglycerol--serine O-phosphatidyltransferase [Bacteroidetes bacterium]|nr:MAG: CDP-diacylglycerol--serine O-phosphatidyltransferase [Bacteroidota bacterium]
MNLKPHIPNLLTSANLFCGLLAIVCVCTGQIRPAMVLLGLALMFDFLDGFAARALKVSSPIGKELDSLADMVTFGVLPGFILARLIQQAQGLPFLPETFWQAPFPLWWVAFVVPLFSALRLAKFNVDTRQSDAFYGLPTPAHTILIASYWLIAETQSQSLLAVPFSNVWVLIIAGVLSSLLLVADVRLIALKFSTFELKPNLFRYLLLLISLLLLVFFQIKAIPFIILAYILLSLIENLRKR